MCVSLCLSLCLCLSVCLCVSIKVSTSVKSTSVKSTSVKSTSVKCQQVLLFLCSFHTLCSLYWDFSIQRHKHNTSHLSLFSLSLLSSLFSLLFSSLMSLMIPWLILSLCLSFSYSLHSYPSIKTYRLTDLGKSLLLLLLSSHITHHIS